MDGDANEERNRDRAIFEGYENKAWVKARDLALACSSKVRIMPVPEYATPRNVRRLSGEGDVVFLCADNHASRKLVGNRCRRIEGVVLISGGDDGTENGRAATFGNVKIYLRKDGRDVSRSSTRFHAEVARPTNRRPDERGCEDLVQAAPQLLFTNLAVVAAMVGWFYAWLSGTLDYEEAYLDLSTGRMTPVKRHSRRSRRLGGPNG
jgi:hypothetical protein